MAHHIADLIAKSEKADGAESEAAKERCATAILELWTHRAALTGRSKPFQELAPIIETLRALDPEADHFFHRRMIPNPDEPVNEEAAVWLKFAMNCDAIARMLIGIGVDKAYENAGDSAADWANVASKAGFASDFDIRIVEFLERENDAPRRRARQIDELNERIRKIDAFSELVLTIRRGYEEQVENLRDAPLLDSPSE